MDVKQVGGKAVLKIILKVVPISILIVCVGFIAFSYFGEHKSNEKIVLTGITSEIENQIMGQLNYSSSDLERLYYSPSLDLAMKYMPSEVQVLEDSSQLSFYFKNESYEIFGNSGIIKKVTGLEAYTDPQGYFVKILNGIESISNVKLVSSGGNGEIKYVTFEYELTSVLETEPRHYVETYYIRQFENSSLVISYKDLNPISKSQIESIIFMINSLQKDNSAGDSIAYEIKEGGFGLNANKKEWQLSELSTDSIFLVYNSANLETNPKYKYDFASIQVNTYYHFDEETSESKEAKDAYILQLINEESESEKSYKTERSFQILDTNKTLDVAGITLMGYTSKASQYKGSEEYEYDGFYMGYLENSNVILNIKFTYNHPDSNGAKSIVSVIDSIEAQTIVSGLLKERNSLIATFLSKDSSGSVLGENIIEIDKAAIVGKPGIVHIYSRSCVELFADGFLKETSKRSYNFCSGSFGTGFFVTENGYIISNAHVAAMPPAAVFLDAYEAGIRNNNPEVMALLKALKADTNATMTQLTSFISSEIISPKHLTFSGTYEDFVEGSVPFEIDPKTYKLVNVEKHSKAVLVDYNKIELSNENLTKIPDLALLKIQNIDGQKFPALDLFDSNAISSGQRVIVIGFPGLASNEMFVSSLASMIPSITQGNVSAVKPNSDNTYDLIQIDASIEHGNSGGPILATDGSVIGVATYIVGQETSADINFGVSVEEVEKLIQRNGISVENLSVSSKTLNGLNDFEKSYYKRSLGKLNEVIAISPKTSEVLNPFISLAQDQIAKGNDKTPLFSILGIDITSNMAFWGGIIVCLLSIVLTVIIVLLKAFVGEKNTVINDKKFPLLEHIELVDIPIVSSNSVGQNIENNLSAVPVIQQVIQPVQSDSNAQINAVQYMPPQVQAQKIELKEVSPVLLEDSMINGVTNVLKDQSSGPVGMDSNEIDQSIDIYDEIKLPAPEIDDKVIAS